MRGTARVKEEALHVHDEQGALERLSRGTGRA